MFKIMTRPSLLCISISEKDKIMLPLVFNGWIEMSNHRNAENVCCRFDNKRRIGPFQQKVVHWLYCKIRKFHKIAIIHKIKTHKIGIFLSVFLNWTFAKIKKYILVHVQFNVHKNVKLLYFKHSPFQTSPNWELA
jgi:hypothetical protein